MTTVKDSLTVRCPKCQSDDFPMTDYLDEDGWFFETRTCTACKWWHSHSWDASSLPYIGEDATEDGWVLPDWVVAHQDQARLL